MKFSGRTRCYAVLGHPIGHSLSPVMHNASFQSLGLDAVYLAFDVEPSRLIEVLRAVQDMGFGGVNLTVPLKQVAFEGLERLDQSARALGAVNTVRFLPNRELEGYNTDGDGFIRAIEEAFGRSVAGLSVFVLGCGGAGRAVAITCAVQGARRLALSDIEPGRASRVAGDITQISREIEILVVPAESDSWKAASVAAELMVQATPLGMKTDDPVLLGADAFCRGQMVYDLIYMYPETALLKAARQSGARTANGLGMLLHQGAKAFTIWTGRQPDVEAMRKALEIEVYAHQRGKKRGQRQKTQKNMW
ncbi:MAG: shikimate dehydrogenase [Deltaproteobacteria bacterium]|nr:shikimate dehydrogenase [Deltaproteobacteria bacterium]